jgi:hypothetical protein
MTRILKKSHSCASLPQQRVPEAPRVEGLEPDVAAVTVGGDPSPAAMKEAGTNRMATQLLKLAPRMGRRQAEEITQALSEQTVVVVGTNAAATLLPCLAEQLAALRRQRSEIAVVVENWWRLTLFHLS